MAQNGLSCADVPLRNYSLTRPPTYVNRSMSPFRCLLNTFLIHFTRLMQLR